MDSFFYLFEDLSIASAQLTCHKTEQKIKIIFLLPRLTHNSTPIIVLSSVIDFIVSNTLLFASFAFFVGFQRLSLALSLLMRLTKSHQF